jgi:hypothetical protein
LQSYYQDPTATPSTLGPDPGEATTTRTDFDDIDDYNGWTESPPRTKTGTALSGYTGWAVSIVVDYVNPATPNGPPSEDLNLKRVVVTVTDPFGKQVVMKGLRAKQGADEKAPYVFADHIQWVGLDLRTKNAATTLHGGAQTIDQATIGN